MQEVHTQQRLAVQSLQLLTRIFLSLPCQVEASWLTPYRASSILLKTAALTGFTLGNCS